jgi:hypothetical protein
MPATRRVADITAERLAQLNAGAQATTLTECLAIDFASLMRSLFPQIDDDACSELRKSASTGISRRMPLAARLITTHIGHSALDTLVRHRSDTARGWACFIIAGA